MEAKSESTLEFNGKTVIVRQRDFPAETSCSG